MNLIDKIPEKLIYVLIFFSLIVLEYQSFHINTDLAVQLNTLVNFANGHGISLVNINDKGKFIYEQCSSWPAGLVIFLYPIYYFIQNTIASAIILKFVSYFFFLLFLYRYLIFLNLESSKRKLISLYFLFGVVPFMSFYSSDVLGTVLCLWGFYFFLKYQDNENFLYLLFSFFFLSMGYFVKYVFVPFLFYPILSLLLKEKLKLFDNAKKMIQIFSLTILFLFLTYFINFLLVGKPGTELKFDAFKGNAHWDQLSHFDGFLMGVGHFKRISINRIKVIGINLTYGEVSAFLTIVIYFFLTHIFFIKKKYEDNFRFTNSLNISFSAGLFICFFLTFMALNIPGVNQSNNFYWTYVEDTRYFGPVIFIGLINILFIAITYKKKSFVHALIFVIIIFNIIIYTLVMRNGFWWQNYSTFLAQSDHIKSKINDISKKENNIILYNSNSFIERHNLTNTFLQSQGYTLLDYSKSKYIINENSYDIYKTEMDSIIKIK